MRLHYTEGKVRKLLTRLAGFFILALVSLKAQDQNRLDSNPALFSVLAAYTAAAEEQGSPSALNHELRETVTKHLATRKLTVLADLRKFFEAHRQSDSGADLAQYVSFALSSGEPPEFQPTLEGAETPPDVQFLAGFQSLMARFYREAQIGPLWAQVEPLYDKEIARYHTPVTEAVLQINGYLRNPTSGYMGRRFIVYLDLLAPGNQVHTRSYKDDYFIVVTPSAEVRIADIRHAYLHYLLDPLSTKYAERINKRWPLIDLAEGAPSLDPRYKADFLLLTTESLIKSIESRLDKSPAHAQQALAEGFILTPFFSEHLPAYEKQESAMRLYLPQMLDQIDLSTESKRLEHVQFASKPAVRSAPSRPAPAAETISPAQALVDEGEKLYTARQFEAARRKFLDALTATDNRTVQARSNYGLARIAIFEKNLDLAEQLFQRTLASAPDAHTRSWAEVYLGRLYENTPTPQTALDHYRAALAVQGAPPGAHQAAVEGIKKFSQKQ